VGVDASVAVITAACPNDGFNSGRPGSDYRNMTNLNVEQCASECKKDGRCAAFTLKLDQEKGSSSAENDSNSTFDSSAVGTCFFKFDQPKTKNQSNSVSGACAVSTDPYTNEVGVFFRSLYCLPIS
jgi:hypothetical protein